MFGKRNKLNLLKLYAAEIKDEAIDVLSPRRRQKRQRVILFLTSVVWLLAGSLLILIINLLIFLPGLKQIYWQSLEGKGQLEKVSGLIAGGQWQELNKVSLAAESNFLKSLGELKKLRLSPIGWLPFTRDKINDGIYLVQTGGLISQSLAKSSAIIDGFFALLPGQATLDLSKMNQQQKLNLMKLITASQLDLEQAKRNLNQAQEALAKITNRRLIADQGIDLDALSQTITDNQTRVDKALSLSKLLPILGGYPNPTNYLFILQNSDELRPTGGFIGTFGLAQAVNGDLPLLKTSDVYHLDMPVRDRFKVEPPLELKKYLGINNWYLRDANWSPDWPTSAKKIIWFYTEENKLLAKPDTPTNFDLVIGLTPKAIIDLLEITGPITARGQVYNRTNFMALLQDTTGRDFPQLGLSSWDRKAVIGDIAREMQTRILSSLDKSWSRLLEIVSENLDEKNILIYTTNSVIYDLARNNDWLGEIRETTGDYLMVVDANMAAFKTDAVVNKSVDYSLKETSDGLVAKLTINYANRGNFSWKTTRYRSFTRIYVPRGSQLLKVAGFSGTQDEVTQGEEAGKTYFGAFVEIDPGKIGGLSFEYKLPYNLYALYQEGAYDLLLQKQPGAKIGEITLDWQFLRPIKSYEPAVFYSYVTGSRFRYKGDLITDKAFSLKF